MSVARPCLRSTLCTVDSPGGLRTYPVLEVMDGGEVLRTYAPQAEEIESGDSVLLTRALMDQASQVVQCFQALEARLSAVLNPPLFLWDRLRVKAGRGVDSLRARADYLRRMILWTGGIAAVASLLWWGASYLGTRSLEAGVQQVLDAQQMARKRYGSFLGPGRLVETGLLKGTLPGIRVSVWYEAVPDDFDYAFLTRFGHPAPQPEAGQRDQVFLFETPAQQTPAGTPVCWARFSPSGVQGPSCAFRSSGMSEVSFLREHVPADRPRMRRLPDGYNPLAMHGRNRRDLTFLATMRGGGLAFGVIAGLVLLVFLTVQRPDRHRVSCRFYELQQERSRRHRGHPFRWRGGLRWHRSAEGEVFPYLYLILIGAEGKVLREFRPLVEEIESTDPILLAKQTIHQAQEGWTPWWWTGRRSMDSFSRGGVRFSGPETGDR